MKNEAESQAVLAVSYVRNVRGRAMLPDSTVKDKNNFVIKNEIWVETKMLSNNNTSRPTQGKYIKHEIWHDSILWYLTVWHTKCQ